MSDARDKIFQDLMRQLTDGIADAKAQAANAKKAQQMANTIPQGNNSNLNNNQMQYYANGFTFGTHTVQNNVPLNLNPSNYTMPKAASQKEIDNLVEGDIVGWPSSWPSTFKIINRGGEFVDVIGFSGNHKDATFGRVQLNDGTIIVKKGKPPKPKIVFSLDKLDALIIEKTVKDEITAVLKQHKNADKLFKEWGLGDTIEYGKGMTFMFWGSPGTGKTWGATCIAKALGTQLMTISAADIQSSEPGGSNRAIQEAFATAKKEEMVLFIDECDSLIASRNDLGMILASEVNTLLTEIEKFEGVCILATNRIDQMDEALERRISLIVEFPKPDFESRKQIWGKLMPQKLPLGEGVTVEVLASHELTGGQIKNVVLQAARLALAEELPKVEVRHFNSAIERLKKSKNLMGHSSRYRQGYKEGATVGKTSAINSKFRSFLDDFDKDEEVTN